jgi:hypothetical protein
VANVEKVLQAMSDMSVSDDPMKALTRNKNEQVSLFWSIYLPASTQGREDHTGYRGRYVSAYGITNPVYMNHKIKSTSMVSYDCEIVESYEFIKTCDFLHSHQSYNITV